MDYFVSEAELHEAQQERRRERHCRGACTHCGEDVYDWEDHYDVDGVILHDDCLVGWAHQYRVSA